MEKNKILILNELQARALEEILYEGVFCSSGCIFPEFEDTDIECEQCPFHYAVENLKEMLEDD